MGRQATNIPAGIRPAKGPNGKTVYKIKIRHNGKPERCGTYPSIEMARTVLKEIRDKQAAGTFNPDDYRTRVVLHEERPVDPSLSDVVDEYLAAQFHLTASSYATYKTACNKIKEAAKDTLWTKVTREMIQTLVLSVQKAENLKTLKILRGHDEDFLEDLIEDIEQKEADAVGKRGRPKKNGGGVHSLVNVLRNVYAYGVGTGLTIPEIDPLFRIDTFIAKHEPFLINPYTEEEKHAYLDHLSTEPGWFRMWSYMCFGTGGRLGETIAVTIPMMNVVDNEIKIWRQYHKKQIRAPKFDSMRTVSMPYDVKEVFLEWLEQIRWERKFHGRESELHHWVLPSWKNPKNFPLSAGFVAQYYCEYLTRIGLPHRRVHDIRHTVATRLIREGEQLHVVKDIMGHKDINTTIKIYVHVSTEERRMAMEKLFSREDRPTCPTCKRPLTGPLSMGTLPSSDDTPEQH